MKTAIGITIVLLLLFASIGLSFLLQDFLFLIIGILIEIIFITFFFKPKLLSKSLFARRVHHDSGHRSDKMFIRALRVDLSKVRLFSDKSIVFVLGAIIFSYLAIFNYFHVNSNDPISGYLLSSLKYFQSNTLFLLLIPVLVILYFLPRGKKKLRSPISELSKSLVIITLSFLASLPIIFLIGLVHIAFLSMSYGSSGYIRDQNQIKESLSQGNVIPQIVIYDDSTKRELILTNIDTLNGKSDFYEKNIINRTPDAIFSLIKSPDEEIFLYNNILAIKVINQEAIESISPTLGRTILRLGIPSKNIKDEPSVDVLNRQEYLKLREDQINEQIDAIGLLIDEIQIYINNNYASINEAKSKIQVNKNGLDQSIAAREDNYNYCKTAGYSSIYFGFYRYYTDAECEAIKQRWDSIITGYQKNISDWEQALKESQYYLSENLKIKDTLITYQEFVRATKDLTPNELGLFLPERQIKVALDTTQKEYIKEYVATLIHEYLHYTSYVSGERILEHSLEEGITEYLSRKIANEMFGGYRGVGYPVMVKIVEAMSNKLSYNDLLDIYFTKDQTRLETMLNQAYGKDFYKDSEFYFQMINYLPSDEALKYANNILVRMGGKTITEEDIK